MDANTRKYINNCVYEFVGLVLLFLSGLGFLQHFLGMGAGLLGDFNTA